MVCDGGALCARTAQDLKVRLAGLGSIGPGASRLLGCVSPDL